MALQTMNWNPIGLTCVIVLQWDTSLSNPTHLVLSVTGSTSPFTPPVVGQNLEGSAFLTAYSAAQPVVLPQLGAPGTFAIFDFSGLAAGSTNFPILPSSIPSGLYRLTGFFKITQAATTSSTLGPLTLTYTGFDGVSVTQKLAYITSAGALATTNATNSITSTGLLSFIPFTFYAKTGAAILANLTYASSGATPMQYESHFRLEAL